jgi:hypothetical protein
MIGFAATVVTQEGSAQLAARTCYQLGSSVRIAARLEAGSK